MRSAHGAAQPNDPTKAQKRPHADACERQCTISIEIRLECKKPGSLRVRRHLHFFEDDVLTHYWIVLLELKLTLLQALVLGRVVGKAGAGTRNESDVVSHGTRGVSRNDGVGNDLCTRGDDFLTPSRGITLDLVASTWLTPRPFSGTGPRSPAQGLAKTSPLSKVFSAGAPPGVTPCG